MLDRSAVGQLSSLSSRTKWQRLPAGGTPCVVYRLPAIAVILSDWITLNAKSQNLPFQQILSTVDFFYLLDCLTITGLDRTYQLIILFLVLDFNFLFIPCGRLS